MDNDRIAGVVVSSTTRPPSISARLYPKGLVQIILATVLGWWVASKRPPDVPSNLRDDIGLPPTTEVDGWWNYPPSLKRRDDHE